eukprot:6471899-Ditylum_brightwellii.AAC.1
MRDMTRRRKNKSYRNVTIRRMDAAQMEYNFVPALHCWILPARKYPVGKLFIEPVGMTAAGPASSSS